MILRGSFSSRQYLAARRLNPGAGPWTSSLIGIKGTGGGQGQRSD